MSNRLGMDPVVVRGCADQLDHVADALAHIASTANAVVGRFGQHWDGGDAEELAHRWQYRHRAEITALAEHVKSMASTARTNANEQERTSSVGSLDAPGGAAIGRGSGSTLLSGVPGIVERGRHVLDLAVGATGAAFTFARLGMIGGLANRSNSLGMLLRADHMLDDGKFFGPAGKVLNRVGIGFDAFKIADDLAEGKPLTRDMIESGVDFVATKNIYVAAGKASYDLTNMFLTGTPAGRAIVESQNTAALSVGAAQVGGDPYRDVEAASRLAHRYDGASGFGHFVTDSVRSWF